MNELFLSTYDSNMSGNQRTSHIFYKNYYFQSTNRRKYIYTQVHQTEIVLKYYIFNIIL